MQTSPQSSGSSATSRLPLVLMISADERAEMRPIVGWLRTTLAASSHIVSAESVSLVQTKLAEGEYPDLIVVLQGWSDEYSQTDVNQLFALAPLARIVVCYGAWCESDGRIRELWPPAVRVPVWAASARIEAEWQLITSSNGHVPLPLSASREEVFAADRTLASPWPDRQTIVVDTPDPAYRQFLGEYLTALGHGVSDTNASVLLFDADPWNADRRQSLEALQAKLPQALVSILTNFASPENLSAFEELGISSVIHKLGFRQSPPSFR